MFGEVISVVTYVVFYQVGIVQQIVYNMNHLCTCNFVNAIVVSIAADWPEIKMDPKIPTGNN